MDNDFTAIVDQSAKNVLDLVKEICTTIGPGVPFSPQEAQRAHALSQDLLKYTDQVEIETFATTNAYLGWFRPGCILVIIAAGCFFLSLLDFYPIVLLIISFLSGLFVFLILLLEFFLSFEFIDFLFPKHQSQNVIAHIYPKSQDSSQDRRRIIMFSGHHDTSPEFLLLKHFKNGYYVGLVLLFASVVAVMIAPAIRLGILFTGGIATHWDWNIISFAWFSALILPVGLACGWWFMENPKNGGSVPGAIDNLTSSCIAAEMAKILKNHPEIQPNNTEIRCCSWGAEEANMKGSWAYAKRHLDELRTQKAILINMESISDSEITILTSDNNGFTKNDVALVNALRDSAQTAQVPYKIAPFPFGGGGTDAYGFSRYGLKAISLFSLKVPEHMVQFYHQSSDNYDKVNLTAVKNVFRILLQFLRDFEP